jgi:hypothetical protein
MDFLQCAELSIAVGAPASAIKDDYKRPATKQIFRAPEHAVTVRKFKARHMITSFERPLRLSRLNQFFGEAIYGDEPLGRNHGTQLGGELVELLLQRHVKDSVLFFFEIPKRSERTLWLRKSLRPTTIVKSFCASLGDNYHSMCYLKFPNKR